MIITTKIAITIDCTIIDSITVIRTANT